MWVLDEIKKKGSIYESRKSFYYSQYVSTFEKCIDGDASIDELEKYKDIFLCFGDYKDTKEILRKCDVGINYLQETGKNELEQIRRNKKKKTIIIVSAVTVGIVLYLLLCFIIK